VGEAVAVRVLVAVELGVKVAEGLGVSDGAMVLAGLGVGVLSQTPILLARAR